MLSCCEIYVGASISTQAPLLAILYSDYSLELDYRGQSNCGSEGGENFRGLCSCSITSSYQGLNALPTLKALINCSAVLRLQQMLALQVAHPVLLLLCASELKASQLLPVAR